MKSARIWIYYKDKFGKLHHEAQGKVFEQSGKVVYLADMTPNKLWRNYNGYSIAQQMLDAFSKTKIKPQIIYREKEKGTLLYANLTLFTKKGIFVAYGNHEQWVLPLRQFTAVQGQIENEPHDLPDIDLSDWVRMTINSIPVQTMLIEDMTPEISLQHEQQAVYQIMSG